MSRGGIFVRTREPLPIGSTLRFEFRLQDGSPLIGGTGMVVWNRAYDPSRPGVAAGMGVRFDRLTEESQGMLDRILSEKRRRSGEPHRGVLVDLEQSPAEDRADHFSHLYYLKSGEKPQA